MVVGAAAAGEVRADAELVPSVPVPRDVERVHGGSLAWMFDIPIGKYSARLPHAMIPTLLVSHST